MVFVSKGIRLVFTSSHFKRNHGDISTTILKPGAAAALRIAADFFRADFLVDDLIESDLLRYIRFNLRTQEHYPPIARALLRSITSRLLKPQLS